VTTFSRRLCRFVAVALVACLAAPTFASAQERPRSQSSFFRSMLLNDRGTATSIARLLRSRAAFVESRVLFGDLTGDGKTDAVASVAIPGAAGAVAVYVYSSHGVRPDSRGRTRLRAIYRNQSLYRAGVEIRGGSLLLRLPRYRAGESFWSPATLVERHYGWRERDRRLRFRGSREVAGPGARRTRDG
jgi:hypothetical protein